jgi:hypothetical protein
VFIENNPEILLPPDLNLEVDRVVEQPVIIEEHEVNMTPPPP